MPGLKLRRIDLSAPQSRRELNKLRNQFRTSAQIVTPAAKKLTQAVFGEPLTPTKSVERILADVKAKGVQAVLHYTEAFDKVTLSAKTLRIPAEELAEAYASADEEFLDTIRSVRENIMQFQMGLLNKDAMMPHSEHYEISQRYRPMRRVGICIPGGAAAYPSSLLMTVCPAQAAEVKEIAVVMPPTATGAYNKDMLAVCHALGVTEVYRVGGPQAVAALAYGVEGIPAVDMIVGPGNIYVALAKRQLYGEVAIDCFAGPSEVIIVADQAASPEYIALDLIAQAEHSPGVPILITWHAPLIEEVEKILEEKLETLARGAMAKSCLEDYGAFIVCRDVDEAVEIVNELAIEHLHIQTRNPSPELFADRIENAAAIFLGPFTPVALGDYAAGPSHCLPTGGTARFSSGLSANDFRKRTSVVNFTKNGLREIAEDVIYMANKEGLTGHAESVAARLRDAVSGPRPPKKPAAKVKK